MIIGLGTDLVDIARIEKSLEKFGDKFIQRNFTAAEQIKTDANHLAKRFAAKEAMSKALGTGIAGGIEFKDIEVRNDEAGKPYITLYNKALETLQNMTPTDKTISLHLSLSDEKNHAMATVVISAE